MVRATNIQTGVQYESVTTQTGDYTISQVPAGAYSLSVEAPGFNKFVQQGIRIYVAQSARIDVVRPLIMSGLASLRSAVIQRSSTANPAAQTAATTKQTDAGGWQQALSAQSDNVLFEQSRNVLLTQVRLGRWTKDNY
jgi:hypothetical protein